MGSAMARPGKVPKEPREPHRMCQRTQIASFPGMVRSVICSGHEKLKFDLTRNDGLQWFTLNTFENHQRNGVEFLSRVMFLSAMAAMAQHIS